MSGGAVKNFLSKILNPYGDHQSDINMEFHSQFSVEGNSLNGLCLRGVYVPEEILLNIFVHLPPPDVLTCSLVCKRWCNIAKSNVLWQTKFNVKEHPKRANNLPWYVFYSYFTTDNFTNLLKNGNGQQQFQHWTIVCNGGDKFRIEDPPQGADPLPLGVPEFDGHTSCFATSYESCSKYQKIDLAQKKLLRYIIQKYKPVLYLSEWYCARYDCACVYRLAVRCDTKDYKWTPENPRGGYRHYRNDLRHEPSVKESTSPHYLKFRKDEIEQWAGREWKKMEVTTDNYPENVDTIYFCHEGQDSQFWAGHYGSKMAGGLIKFLFESIRPTEDDISDSEEAEDV